MSAVAHLEVQRISDPSRLAELATVWDELIDEDSCGAVFRSPAWLLPWWSCFSHERQLAVFVASAGSEVRGVLPAYRVRTAFGGWRLRLMGDGLAGSDYLGLAARAMHQSAVAMALARTIVAQEHDVVLDGLLNWDPLASALQHAAQRAGIGCSIMPSERCPFVLLSQSPAASQPVERPQFGHGVHIGRQRRRLQKQPGYHVEVLSGEREIELALPTLWRLHHGRWATRGGSDALLHPQLPRFQHESALALARRGWARLYLVHVDGAPRAALYGFGRGHRFAYYQSGWDPDFRQWSLGTAVVSVALEDTLARGLTEFDFLRGDEAYKWRFASGCRQLVCVRLTAGPGARLLRMGDTVQLAVRAGGRRVLPDRLVSWLVRRQRQFASRGRPDGRRAEA